MENSGQRVVLPAGILYISHLNIPSGVELSGALKGGETILMALPGKENAMVSLQPNSKLSHLRLGGVNGSKNGVETTSTSSVVLKDLVIGRCRYGIEADHAGNFEAIHCDISQCQRGINLEFCRDVRVANNNIHNVQESGIQFWGNWQWQQKVSRNLFFSRNEVSGGSKGGIWGTGATHVRLLNNHVSNFGDVGLDLEWCDQGIISGNTVTNCRNAGISLFYSCHDVLIMNNHVMEKAPIGNNPPASGQWQGIWLTGTNQKVYPQDRGHVHIVIAHNHVVQIGSSLPPIDVAPEATGVILTGNTVVFQHHD